MSHDAGCNCHLHRMPLEQTKDQYDFYTSLHGLAYRKVPLAQIAQRVESQTTRWARTVVAAAVEWRRRQAEASSETKQVAIDELAAATTRGLQSLTSNTALSSSTNTTSATGDTTHVVADAIVSAVGNMYLWGSLPLDVIHGYGSQCITDSASAAAPLMYFWCLWQAFAKQMSISVADKRSEGLQLPTSLDSRIGAFLARYIVMNTCDTSGYTMLHYASRGGSEEIVRYAITPSPSAGGATDPTLFGSTNVFAATASGQTCLHRAVAQGHTTIAQHLLRTVDWLVGPLQASGASTAVALGRLLKRDLLEGTDSAGRSAVLLARDECPEAERASMVALLAASADKESAVN